MYIYLIIMLSVFFIGFLLDNNFVYGNKQLFKNRKIWQKYFFGLFILVILCLAIFREGIGTDYNVYEIKYDNILVNDYDFDFLFLSYLRFFRFFNFPFQYIIALFACLNILPLYYIWRYFREKYSFISLGLYIGFGYFGMSLNVFRQYAAVSLLLIGMFLFLNKSYKGFIVFCLLAITVHSSALLALPFLLISLSWIPKKTQIQIISIVVSLIFIFIPSSFINDLIYFGIEMLGNISMRYTGYLTAEGTFAFRTFNQGLALLPSILFFPSLILLTKIFGDKKYTLARYEEYMLKVYYGYICFISFKMGSEMIDRFLAFFSITQIFAFPILIRYVYDKYPKFLALVLQIIFIGTAVFMLLRYMTNNVAEIFPYQWIFSDK